MSHKDGRGVKTRGFTRKTRRDSTKHVGGKRVSPYVKVKVGRYSDDNWESFAPIDLETGKSIREVA